MCYTGSMPKISAGLLMYRRSDSGPQVLLVHPGGPFWKNKDDGAWSIPKGEAAEGEDLLAAAKREFEEELGFAPSGTFVALSPVKQKGGKIVHAWRVEGDCDPSQIRSNTFEMEWPPKSGKRASFPEVDRAAWFDLGEARRKILASQLALLDQLDEVQAL
jgi:predicted NUDIX family NTP pyrophosphohydrolase